VIKRDIWVLKGKTDLYGHYSAVSRINRILTDYIILNMSRNDLTFVLWTPSSTRKMVARGLVNKFSLVYVNVNLRGK